VRRRIRTDDCTEVGHCCCSVFHDIQANQGFETPSSEPLFIGNEADQTKCAKDQRNQSSPMAPWIHDTSPGKRDQESAERCNEENCANPVDSSKLFGKGAGPVVETQEQNDENRAESDEWQVDPEDPYPRNVLGEASPEKWSADSSYNPSETLTSRRPLGGLTDCPSG
jgi:hypothetical protein